MTLLQLQKVETSIWQQAEKKQLYGCRQFERGKLNTINMEENESLFPLPQTFLLGIITMMKRDIDIFSL